MNSSDIARAAELLGTARLAHCRVDTLPSDCLPANEAEGYAIQDALDVWLEAHGSGTRAGYKIGLVSADMRRAMGGLETLGFDSPASGSILSTTVYEREANIPFDSFFKPYVEGEIAVQIGRDTATSEAPFTRDSIAHHVEACMAAIELVDWQVSFFDYDPPLAPLMLADGGSNSGCVVGRHETDWRALDLAALNGRMTVDGVEVGAGVGADLQGHPFEVLAWLANSLASRGKQLHEGEIVLLGAVTPSFGDIAAGAEVVVTWKSLGDVKVRFD